MGKRRSAAERLEKDALRFLNHGERKKVNSVERTSFGRKKYKPYKPKKAPKNKKKRRRSTAVEQLEEEARRFVEDAAHTADDGKLKRSLTAFVWDRKSSRPARDVGSDEDTEGDDDDDAGESSSKKAKVGKNAKPKKKKMKKKSKASTAGVTFSGQANATVKNGGKTVKFSTKAMTTVRSEESFESGSHTSTFVVNAKSACCMTIGAVESKVDENSLNRAALYSVGYGYRTYSGPKGQYWGKGSSQYNFGTAYGDGDKITVELDLDANQITFKKNGTAIGGDGIDEGSYHFAVCSDGNGEIEVED